MSKIYPLFLSIFHDGYVVKTTTTNKAKKKIQTEQWRSSGADSCDRHIVCCLCAGRCVNTQSLCSTFNTQFGNVWQSRWDFISGTESPHSHVVNVGWKLDKTSGAFCMDTSLRILYFVICGQIIKKDVCIFLTNKYSGTQYVLLKWVKA